MTDQDNTLRDDIAFLRTLAEEGGRGPLGGGATLLAAGLVYAAASLISWSVFEFGWTRNGLVFPLVWFAAAALFLLPVRFMRARSPAVSGTARGARAAWSGGGWAILVLAVSMMILAQRANAWWIMAVLGPISMSIYGGCWLVAASLARQRWLLGVALGSFVMTGVLAWFATDAKAVFLLFAAGLLGLVALPGFVLMRQAPASA